VLEALSGTCTLYLQGRAALHHLLMDAAVLYVVVALHALVLMCQALVYCVAMNSKKNALLGLLIAANFVEIKVGWARGEGGRWLGGGCQSVCVGWGGGGLGGSGLPAYLPASRSVR
jgi:hypothetical protein